MPAWLLPLIMGLGAAGSAAASAYGSKKQAEASSAQAEQDRILQEAIASVRESELDPFRNQNFQAGAINNLDMLERSAYTPVTFQGPAGLDPKFIPRFSGGTTYTKSPEAIQSYGALKRSVMGGESAPGVLGANKNNPNALNLLSLFTNGGRSGSPEGYPLAPWNKRYSASVGVGSALRNRKYMPDPDAAEY